jgi:PRTRC genetic system protein A
MKNINPDSLGVPVYLKTEDKQEWANDKLFYLLTKDGLFLCRNHEWFRSCALAKRGPAGLAGQKPMLELSYPRLPRVLLERAVAFFRLIYEEKYWESALILVWNKTTRQMELLCPDQKADPGAVNYDIPALPPNLLLVGDIHSHGSGGAYASFTDKEDETNRPGVHIVAGRIMDKRPEFHIEVVVDGERFKVEDHGLILEGFENCKHAEVPADWRPKVKKGKFNWEGSSNWVGGFGGIDGGGYRPNETYNLKEIESKDQAKADAIFDRFRGYAECPTYEIVRTALFAGTSHINYFRCEEMANEFVKTWAKKGTNEKLIGKE